MVYGTFDKDIPETTPPEKQVWNDPDPGVKWALDLIDLDNQPHSIFSRFWKAGLGGFAGFMGMRIRNRYRKIPR